MESQLVADKTKRKKKPTSFDLQTSGSIIVKHIGSKYYEFKVEYYIIDNKITPHDIKVWVNKKPYPLSKAISSVGKNRLKLKITNELSRITSVGDFDLQAFAV